VSQASTLPPDPDPHPHGRRTARTLATADLPCHRNLPLLLLQARERVIANFRPALNAAGVTEQQWRIVRALLEQGPLEPRQIVGLCAISSPSLAGVLARMDDLGGWVAGRRAKALAAHCDARTSAACPARDWPPRRRAAPLLPPA
jgi:hypothetical protein